MKTRESIKNEAKQLLGQNYGGILGEGLLIVAAAYALSYLVSLLNIALSLSSVLLSPSYIMIFLTRYISTIIVGFLPMLLTAPLIVGYYDRLKLLWWGQKKQSFFSGFENGRYGRSVSCSLLVYLFTMLWSLLLVVPGIIKGIAYSMTPFIISDSENITATQAIEISKKLTYGYKGDIFVFYLSYFGWYLLSVLTFGVLAIFYVGPYQYTAFAGYYTELKKNALKNGVVTLADFDYEE